jgi:1-acyl-sn-glycerol-3-phosphate acyltransferase
MGFSRYMTIQSPTTMPTLTPEKLLDRRDPQLIRQWLPYGEWFYDHYFRVTTDGWHHIPQTEPVLLVGSHNGGLASPDTVMMMVDWFRLFGCDRLVYGLMHPKVWQVNPRFAKLAMQMGAIPATPQGAIAALHRQATVLVYPGGAQEVFRPHSQRDRIQFCDRKGFIKLALRQKVKIIPLISYGAHDTLIVLGDCYQQAQKLHKWGMPWLYNVDPEVFPIYLGLPWGLAFGPLPNIPLPISIHTRVCPPITFERYGKTAVRDRTYVNACYQHVIQSMQQSLDRLMQEQSGT